MMLVPSARRRAQAMLEFALAFPIFFGLMMCGIQLGLLLVWYGDEVRLTSDAVRWLSTHPDSSDDAVAAKIGTLMWPTMIGGDMTPVRDPSNDDGTRLTAWKIGRLEARFTPCGAAQAPCTNVDRESPDGVITVELSYDASAIIFLPAHWQLPYMQVDSPTSLPKYRLLLSAE